MLTRKAIERYLEEGSERYICGREMLGIEPIDDVEDKAGEAVLSIMRDLFSTAKWVNNVYLCKNQVVVTCVEYIRHLGWVGFQE